MKCTRISYNEEFRIVLGNERAQAAVMVVRSGEGEGGPDNSHAGADQWLYVESGRGQAIVEGHTVSLEPGTLLLIERGERHEIRSLSGETLRALSFYLPPAYDDRGEKLPAGRSS